MWRSAALSFIGGLLLGGVLLFGSMSKAAAQTENAAPSSDWQVTGGIYSWFPWVQGSMTARDEDFNIYATPIDLIENFDAPPIMANLEVQHGKFSLWGDALYVKFAFGGDFATEASPIPALNFQATGQNNTDFTLGIYQFGGFYEVADFAGTQGNTTLEFGAGARFVQQEFRVKTKIDVRAQARLDRLADVIERRIQRIENQQQRLDALAALNDVRKGVLDKKIVRAEDKGRDRRVARLERRLARVDDRGEALAALEAVERLRFELLRAELRLSDSEFNEQFAIIGTGNVDWVDPTIAMRLQHHFGNGHSVTATGDFGGFNIDDNLSSQMQLTYDIDGMIWGFQTHTTLGYRALWLNYEEQTLRGTSAVNVWLHGPIVEIALRW